MVEIRDLLLFQRESARKNNLDSISISVPRATALINQLTAITKPRQQRPEPSWTK